MKHLFLLLSFVIMSFTTTLPSGHTISKNPNCPCAVPFKNTTEWAQGARGGYYCMATSKDGSTYKRYLSNK